MREAAPTRSAAKKGGLSLFERSSFQDFRLKRLNEMMSSNDFSHIITLREQALKYKERTERKLMSKMLKKGEYSPRTYIAKKHELEVWVSRERKEIRRTRKHFEECYAKTAEMIEQTQQNKEQLHRILLDSKGRREEFWSDAGS